MAKTLYILDGHYQIYRAFYAPFRELTSRTGEPTRATFVFCQMLFALLRDRKPDYLAVAMDAGDETTFRRELDPTYKAQRDPAPEALHVQADRIAEIVRALGVPVLVKEGFEADDLMATIAEQLRGQDVDIYLVSRDKDLEQLIDEHVRLFDVAKGEVLDAETLREKKGYTPAQAVEIQTLSGDATDNVPGIPGVGVKTAAKLIQTYGSADDVVQNAAKLTPKMAERVKSFADRLPLTRRLVTLRRDVPLAFSLVDCATDRLDFQAVRPIFESLDFHRLNEQLADLDQEAAAHSPNDAARAPVSVEHRPASVLAVRYELVDSIKKFEAFVDRLKTHDVFAFDTETTGLNPVAADLVGLSFAWKPGEAYYLPIRAAVGDTLPLDKVLPSLKAIFEDASVRKIGQNIKYDVLVLRQVGIEVRGIAFDTMIASFLLDPLARSHSMDYLADRLLGHKMIPITELIGKGRDQITLDQIETTRVSEYACEDADYTWRLYECLAPNIDEGELATLFRETEMPLVEVLADMEHRGIRLDTELLASIGTSIDARLVELTNEIHAAAGHAFNIASTKQLAEVLFDEQGLEVVRKTRTGRSTDADTLQTLASRGDHPIPKLVLEYRELSKLKTTYVETLPTMVCKKTGRVHASFDQIGAVTGRLASREPNLQNIPVRTETGRRIREAIVPGGGDLLLLAADYSQVELRLLAHFCRDSSLLDAFQRGLDIHRAVAAEVNGVDPNDVTKEQRSSAKAVNFGIIYGQGAFGLARSLGIPVAQAKAFIDTYFERYPGIRSFIDQCIADARRTGYAKTILGRRRPIPELTSRNRQQVSQGERLAINTVVQGSAADLIKAAMIQIHRLRKDGSLQSDLLIQVHDELVFETPASRIDDEAKLIRQTMETALPLDVPIVVDVLIGQNWAAAK